MRRSGAATRSRCEKRSQIKAKRKLIPARKSAPIMRAIPPRTEGCLYSIFRHGAGSGGRGMTLHRRCGARPGGPSRRALRPAHAAGRQAVVWRPCRKARRLKMEVHRGPCGANLTNTARGTPWDWRTCGTTGFDKPRCREASRPAGPISDPCASRAPSVLNRERADGMGMRPTRGRPKNTGDGAWPNFYWKQDICTELKLSSPAQAGQPVTQAVSAITGFPAFAGNEPP